MSVLYTTGIQNNLREILESFDVSVFLMGKKNIIKCSTNKLKIKSIKAMCCAIRSERCFFEISSEITENLDFIALLVRKDEPKEVNSWEFFRFYEWMRKPVCIHIKELISQSIDPDRMLNEFY